MATDDAAMAAGAVRPAVATFLRRLATACRRAARHGTASAFDLAGLESADRAALDALLGRGEVSCRLAADPVAGRPGLRAEEAAFAGVWRVAAPGRDMLEVAPVPRALVATAFAPRHDAAVARTPRSSDAGPRGGQQANARAAAIVAELVAASAAWHEDAPARVIDLAPLAEHPDDLAALDTALGRGAASLEVGGFGTCRIEATALASVWRVRFYNAADRLVLDSFEVAAIPDLARATADDLDESARLIDDLTDPAA